MEILEIRKRIMPEAAARAESEIRSLIENWAKAVRARDIDKVAASHIDDMLMFDVPPPVAVRGA
jgi:ketosteroid isomerase-like protein